MRNDFNTWRRNKGATQVGAMSREDYKRHRMKTETKRAEARVLDPAKKTKRTVTLPRVQFMEDTDESGT